MRARDGQGVAWQLCESVVPAKRRSSIAQLTTLRFTENSWSAILQRCVRQLGYSCPHISGLYVQADDLFHSNAHLQGESTVPGLMTIHKITTLAI